MEKQKQLLRFEEIITTGKTRVYEVYSTHSDDYLGRIHWRSGWRCYVISYADNIDMSISCNNELNLFMLNLELQRKKNLTQTKLNTTELAIPPKPKDLGILPNFI